ncbi:MAG: fluoride efflux transporter CrcB [Pseudomonadota bacterium]|nr:fluoride efflux transporter CrcB [Pseudomonadota bacterium]
MIILLYVGFGGAIGAVLRYGVILLFQDVLGLAGPYATLTVNILGSLVLGIIVGFSVTTWAISPEFKAMLMVGILGGFTTFSAFSMDTVNLLQRDEIFIAFIYVLISVLVSISSFFFSYSVCRQVLQ